MPYDRYRVEKIEAGRYRVFSLRTDNLLGWVFREGCKWRAYVAVYAWGQFRSGKRRNVGAFGTLREAVSEVWIEADTR